MSPLPYTEAALDAVTKARGINRQEGKKSSVVLMHPTLIRKIEQECKTARPLASENCEPAPEFAGLAWIEDNSVDEDEVCVLSDEDYLDHEQKRRDAQGI